MVTENDVKIKKIEADLEKSSLRWGAIKHFCSIGGILFYFKLLEPFFNSNPASINAIASVIEKLNFSNWTGYLFGGGTSIAWSFERKGKKRAIKEKGKYQKISTCNLRGTRICFCITFY